MTYDVSGPTVILAARVEPCAENTRGDALSIFCLPDHAQSIIAAVPECRIRTVTRQVVKAMTPWAPGYDKDTHQPFGAVDLP